MIFSRQQTDKRCRIYSPCYMSTNTAATKYFTVDLNQSYSIKIIVVVSSVNDHGTYLHHLNVHVSTYYNIKYAHFKSLKYTMIYKIDAHFKSEIAIYILTYTMIYKLAISLISSWKYL